MTPYARVTHVLPEDNIVDALAVHLAVTGARPVALTPGEQRTAARHLITHGAATTAIAHRLRLNAVAVKRLHDELDGRQENAA